MNNFDLRKALDIVSNSTYHNFEPNNIKKASSILKNSIKEITKNNIDYDSRYAVAVRELTYLEELLDTDEYTVDFNNQATMTSITIEGIKVIANYNKSQKQAEELKEELEKQGIEIDLYKADVSKREEVKDMINYVLDKYKKIDILINNARNITN